MNGDEWFSCDCARSGRSTPRVDRDHQAARARARSAKPVASLTVLRRAPRAGRRRCVAAASPPFRRAATAPCRRWRVTEISWPSMRNGRCAKLVRHAPREVVRVLAARSHSVTTAKPSPGMRAMVSSGRSTARSRTSACCSTASPTARPCRSTTAPKSVEAELQHAVAACAEAAQAGTRTRASAQQRRCVERAGQPVASRRLLREHRDAVAVGGVAAQCQRQHRRFHHRHQRQFAFCPRRGDHAELVAGRQRGDRHQAASSPAGSSPRRRRRAARRAPPPPAPPARTASTGRCRPGSTSRARARRRAATRQAGRRAAPDSALAPPRGARQQAVEFEETHR